ncbi:hypothetical protein HUE57_14505 [Candidatus Reidiella endopervernicosa]|uniref:Response regulatory domain-containing protein n=1 Tax=Candidatus Reidiella endopervernicosa TaxID=2738883 RepID=A0A6N0HYC5_9GAMM|nr:hypothetical protein [Candidatus Reidiella endopervernicosa]QKQ27355.1 hypothetical protein HUE57_14505 [Candidatus Reidiella endopervernicosa]
MIFISAKNAKADVITGLKAGGRDFISKPIDPDAVRERVSQLLKHAPAKLKHEPVNAKPKRPITEMLDETKTESPLLLRSSSSINFRPTSLLRGYSTPLMRYRPKSRLTNLRLPIQAKIQPSQTQ